MDIKVLEKVVNRKYSLPKMLKKINPDNHYEYGRPCFCPFHDNTKTPAAVIYNDSDGDNLWCYAENKMYKPSDVLVKLYNQDIYEVGELLYNGLTDSEKMSISGDTDYVKEFSKKLNLDEDATKKLLFLSEAYKEYKITLNEYLTAYLSITDK